MKTLRDSDSIRSVGQNPDLCLGDKSTIRRMTLEHLDEVLNIERRVFYDSWSRNSFRFEILTNNYSLPLVLLWEGRVIGYTIIWIIFEEFHIANFAIDPEFHHQGFGSYFLDEALKRAEGLEYALLEVRQNNHAAIRLYEKFGFKKIAVRYGYYSNGDNALIMKKILSTAQQSLGDTDGFSKQESDI